MTEPDTFQGRTYQQSSEPMTVMDVQESDCWPVDDRSVSGTKDQLADGLHPVIAIGGMTEADGRPLNVTGVVLTVQVTTAGTATDRVEVNTADGAIVRQYVSNILTYSGGAPNTFETTPVMGYPVYVDDSDDLSEGVTLSMSPFNTADLPNPLAGHLWYCQDEIADGQAGGSRSTSTFDVALPNEATEQEYCIRLSSGMHHEAA